MTKYVDCPSCQDSIRIEGSEIWCNTDYFPEWEQPFECPHCGHNFLLNVEIDVEVYAVEKEVNHENKQRRFMAR